MRLVMIRFVEQLKFPRCASFIFVKKLARRPNETRSIKERTIEKHDLALIIKLRKPISAPFRFLCARICLLRKRISCQYEKRGDARSFSIEHERPVKLQSVREAGF